MGIMKKTVKIAASPITKPTKIVGKAAGKGASKAAKKTAKAAVKPSNVVKVAKASSFVGILPDEVDIVVTAYTGLEKKYKSRKRRPAVELVNEALNNDPEMSNVKKKELVLKHFNKVGDYNQHKEAKHHVKRYFPSYR